MKAVLLIVVESRKNQCICGSLQSLYQKKPLEFQGLDHMLFLMEDVMDSEGMHAESGEYRHLVGGKECGGYAKETAVQKNESETVKFCPRHMGAADSENVFAVTIQSRQNATIQGFVKNCRGSACFRSGMELIRMIRECLIPETKGEKSVSDGTDGSEDIVYEKRVL